MTTLILGYGNTLSGDDGLGVRAAEMLEERLQGLDVRVITCHQLSPELAEDLRGASLAIFIDASATTPPGQIDVQPLAPSTQAPGSVSHHFLPGTLLALCQAFYDHTPEAWLYAIGAASFEIGETLSPPAAAALPRAVELVEERVRQAHAL
jgi:hydrogenase maturation protease